MMKIFKKGQKIFRLTNIRAKSDIHLQSNFEEDKHAFEQLISISQLNLVLFNMNSILNVQLKIS